MSRTARIPRSRTWLRVLVLLLAVWVPGAHVQPQPAPAPAASAGTSEHDHLDTLPRPPARVSHPAGAPERPAPLPGPAPAPAAAPPGRAVPRPPGAVPLLRTVVLRC
ncbi:hypothetical protein ABZ467_33320 [Streptomyces sp. NPDC005727]|uniref:hypothetical protein n=1 Tax=Streptomyces sp. NPDC005727 TaxID=3157053 RepID=UPI0033D51471